MGDMSNIRQLMSAARSRILLICPDCGQEHLEYADKLRGALALELQAMEDNIARDTWRAGMARFGGDKG